MSPCCGDGAGCGKLQRGTARDGHFVAEGGITKACGASRGCRGVNLEVTEVLCEKRVMWQKSEAWVKFV